MVWFLFCLPYWMTPNGKAKDGIYRRGCFSIFSFLNLQMKNENRYNGWYSYIPFSVFKLGKRKRNLDYPIPIFHYGIGERKTEGRYIQHMALFLFSGFQLAKEKNEKSYNVSYFYFSFFIWGLRKKKRMLSYSFSIFYYEIEKNERTVYTRTGQLWMEQYLISLKYLPI